MTYVRPTTETGVVRFGFIAGKTVGIAVRRNLVRRRLKAIAYELIPELSASLPAGSGVDVVVRALPASAQAGWASLHEEVSRAISRYVSRSTTR